MAWQLIAIWVLVAAAVAWFVRDEHRRHADAELARAARYYAHAPQFRHMGPDATAEVMPAFRQQGLLHADRAYFDRYLGRRLARPFTVSLKR